MAKEFERCTQDVEMGAEASKVYLMAALFEDTLHNLCAYIKLQAGEEMMCLDTMPHRLRCIAYAQMLSYLT